MKTSMNFQAAYRVGNFLNICGTISLPRRHWLMDLVKLCCNLKSVIMIKYSNHATVICIGGWYCYDNQSCLTRWQRLRHLMTSHHWPETRSGMYVTEIPTAHFTEVNIVINININSLKPRGNYMYLLL